MSDISKTKCQELKLTGLLTTFLCNYSKYTNFVLDRVHEPLDIWSAANCWVRAGLGRRLGWVGRQQFYVATQTTLVSYLYSFKISPWFHTVQTILQYEGYVLFGRRKVKGFSCTQASFCVFLVLAVVHFGKNIGGFRNQARHFLNQYIKFDNLTTRTLVCREASGIMASVPVSCLFQAFSLVQFNSGR